MVAASCVVPANTRASPAYPGALPLVQLGLVPQFESGPPPPHVSVEETTVSARFVVPCNALASVTVTGKLKLPGAVPGAMVRLLVQTLGVADRNKGAVVAPPSALRLMVTLLMTALLPGVTVTVNPTVWLRNTPVDGTAAATAVGPPEGMIAGDGLGAKN